MLFGLNIIYWNLMNIVLGQVDFNENNYYNSEIISPVSRGYSKKFLEFLPDMNDLNLFVIST